MFLSSIPVGNAGVRVGGDDGHPAGDTSVDKDGDAGEDGKDGKDGKGVLRVSLPARVAGSAGLEVSKSRYP